jgi:site-specific DNA-methyltransferase (adenine-specific)
MVTDPPAGISFMGKNWDSSKGGRKKWIKWLRKILQEAWWVLKPGAHIFVWALPRTSHWTATAIEDAGFEIRTIVHHHFGTGMPKSQKIGNGWGTGLKPATEHWILARKPLSEKTIVENVLLWDTGGINIDDCRIELKQDENTSRKLSHQQGWKSTSLAGAGSVNDDWKKGRWPADMIHDGSLEVLEFFLNNTSRFFYCAKPSKKEKTCSGLVDNTHPTVKSLVLMKYLITMITPPGGCVLDPFMGSGTTGVAAISLGFKFQGIELEKDSYLIAKKRLKLTLQDF